MLNRKVLVMVRLCLKALVTFNISYEKTIKGVMDMLAKMYKKPSMINNVFFIKKLFNMQMVEGGSIPKYFNEFNIVTNQLSFVNIDIDDEIRALLLLC